MWIGLKFAAGIGLFLVLVVLAIVGLPTIFAFPLVLWNYIRDGFRKANEEKRLRNLWKENQERERRIREYAASSTTNANENSDFDLHMNNLKARR